MRVDILAARCGAAQDLLEAVAGRHQLGAEVEELAILEIAEDEAVVGVPKHEGFAEMVDDVSQARQRKLA